jgi:DNA-binding CsgD family transcriptional regulator
MTGVAMIRMTGESPIRRDQAEGALAWNEQETLDFLEVFSAGMFLIDDNLQVVRSNAAGARRLGAGADGFSRMLARSFDGPAQEIRRQIKEAIAGGVRSTLLLKTGSPDALICSILPMDGAGAATAMVVLTPLMGGSREVVPYLRSLYKLSNAEAEIAAAAAAGMDVVQMAQARNVSIHTLRAQIAGIKTKMGLSRMTEIAVTVGRIEAAVTWL